MGRQGHVFEGRGPGTVWLRLFFCLLLPAMLLPAAADSARLRDVRTRIDALQQQLNETREQRDSVRLQLETLDRRLGPLVNTLRDTERRLRRERTRVQGLERQTEKRRRELAREREELVELVRATYQAGRQSELRLVLEDQSPARLSRTLAYYRYVEQARIERLQRIESVLRELARLEESRREAARELEGLRAAQRREKAQWETLRQERRGLHARLSREVRDRGRSLERLHADRDRLERLVSEIRPLLPAMPPPPAGARFADRNEARAAGQGRPDSGFAGMQGRLPLPLRGQLLARFNDSRQIGNLRWKGIFLAAREGQAVRAVFGGRVVYADWLRGFGLLLILDHGDGYMTLYGHNQSLAKSVGDWAETGETIATAGATGDQSRPGVYFEVRHQGAPADPLRWCTVRAT
ncbi:MAG: peptidoglycan DD-metalloendopeptidase family protein [Pseudomonadota bacterium]